MLFFALTRSFCSKFVQTRNGSGENDFPDRDENLVARLRVFEEWAQKNEFHLQIHGDVNVIIPIYPYRDPQTHVYNRYFWRKSGINGDEIGAVKRVRQYLETPHGKNIGHSRVCMPDEPSNAIEDYSICSELLYYKIIQLVWPQATNFIDVGCNRGFLSAAFLTLWGGNRLGLSPLDLNRALNSPPQAFVSPTPHGVCRTGLNRAYPLHCPGNTTQQQNGRCNRAKTDIRVVSFDGSSNTVEKVVGVINRHFSRRSGHAYDIPSMWQYFHRAVADTKGTAMFSINDENGGAYEGAGIIGKGHGGNGSFERVTQTTIDSFLREEDSLLRGQRVDVLKIDAEGNDLLVCIYIMLCNTVRVCWLLLSVGYYCHSYVWWLS